MDIDAVLGKETMKKKGIYRKLLVTTVIPVLVFGIVITCFCYNRFKKTIFNQTKDTLGDIAASVLIAYDISYPGDFSPIYIDDSSFDLYKGDADITNDFSIIDSYAEATDSEISLLYMDMRVHTSFRSANGDRLCGLCTNSETASLVLSHGEEAFYTNAAVEKEEYLVLYVPIHNSDGTVVGMVEAGKRSSELKKMVWNSVWPVLILSIPGMMLAAFVAYRSASKMTETLEAIRVFLNKVADGKLKTELDLKYLNRQDELGEIARSSFQMEKSIRDSVETDALTGLPNRRYLFNAFEKVSGKAVTTGVPFSLAICDIDLFKKVNDTYGHNIGDEVLKAVAGKLKEGMYGNGYATRWGGEEFILILDKSNIIEAEKILSKILDSIRNMVIKTEVKDISITMTIGAVEGSGTDIDLLIEKADANLYYGKEHGRNQIVTKIDE